MSLLVGLIEKPVSEFLQAVDQLLQSNEANVSQIRLELDAVLSHLAASSQSAESKEPLLTGLLSRLQPRQVSFEDQISAVREQLANIYEVQERWSDAAQTLIGIPLDSGHRSNITDQYKCELYVKIVRLLLEDEDSVNAEAYLNRAALLIHSQTDATLQLAFKVCQARILDFKRKFIDAARKYHELSALVYDPEERTHALSQAILCAVLAPAGPQRSRLLGTLYKDDRVQKHCSPVLSSMLEKVYLERILDSMVVRQFSELLQSHQLATLADGSTVLDRSVLEHNLQAISKVYKNISFESLARLLDVSVEKAERSIAQMFIEQRLQGHVDQQKRFIYFHAESSITLWNSQINNMLHHLNHVLDQASTTGTLNKC